MPKRAAAIAEIEAEEAARPVRRAVAGYDLTFSAPKSVSVLWALTDDQTTQRRGGGASAAPIAPFRMRR